MPPLFCWRPTKRDRVGAAALLADFRAVAAAGLRGSPRAPVQGDAARKALAAADAAIQRLGAQVNPKITLSVLAMKFRDILIKRAAFTLSVIACAMPPLPKGEAKHQRG